MCVYTHLPFSLNMHYRQLLVQLTTLLILNRNAATLLILHTPYKPPPTCRRATPPRTTTDRGRRAVGGLSRGRASIPVASS